MSSDWVDFKAIRGALSFSDILAHYGVRLRKQGRQEVGTCPLPQHPVEKRDKQSFSANLEKRVFQCFSCRSKGNALDFAVLMDNGNPDRGSDVRKTALKLQQVFRLSSSQPATTSPAKPTISPPPEPPVEPNTEDQKVVYNAPLDFILKDLDPNHPYLLNRGFSAETLKHFGVGFCSKGYFKDRAVTPLHNIEGRLVAYAGRLTDNTKVSSTNPKYLFPGERTRNGVVHAFRKSEVLYNANRLPPRVEPLLVVEGFTSVWWLHQLGMENVVAVMGSSISEWQVQAIRLVLADRGVVTVLFDGDEAGRKGAANAASQLATVAPVRIAHLGDNEQPTDITEEDLDEVIGW